MFMRERCQVANRRLEIPANQEGTELCVPLARLRLRPRAQGVQVRIVRMVQSELSQPRSSNGSHHQGVPLFNGQPAKVRVVSHGESIRRYALARHQEPVGAALVSNDACPMNDLIAEVIVLPSTTFSMVAVIVMGGSTGSCPSPLPGFGGGGGGGGVGPG